MSPPRNPLTHIINEGTREFFGSNDQFPIARAPLEVRRSWARLIRMVYEVDPLLCPRCAGTVKVIAVIERPAVVRQILDHLSLSTAAPSFRVPPDPPREWSYEPLFDLPVRRTQTGNLPISDPLLVQAGPMRRPVLSDLPLPQNPQASA